MEKINVLGNEISVVTFVCKGVTCYRALVPAGKYKNHRTKYITCCATSLNELVNRTEHLLVSRHNDLAPMTVEALAKEWLKYKYVRVSPSTYDKVESVVRAHIVPEIDTYFLSELDLRFLQKYIDDLSFKGCVANNCKKNKGLAYNTILKIKSVLNELINYAVNMDYMDKNHLSGVTIPRTVEKPKEKKILADDSLQRFLDEVNRKNEKGEYVHFYRRAILFMLQTGL